MINWYHPTCLYVHFTKFSTIHERNKHNYNNKKTDNKQVSLKSNRRIHSSLCISRAAKAYVSSFSIFFFFINHFLFISFKKILFFYFFVRTYPRNYVYMNLLTSNSISLIFKYVFLMSKHMEDTRIKIFFSCKTFNYQQSSSLNYNRA